MPRRSDGESSRRTPPRRKTPAERLLLALGLLLALLGLKPGDMHNPQGVPEGGEIESEGSKMLLQKAGEWVKRLCELEFLPGVRAASEWLETETGHLARGVRTCLKQLVTAHSVVGEPGPRARVHEIPEDILDECVRVVAANHYRTRWQAGQHCEFLQKVMTQYDCTIFYLFERMQEHEPDLRWCVTLSPKFELSHECTAKRLQYSHDMLKLSRQEMHSIVWIDQKKMYLALQDDIKCWGLYHRPRGEGDDEVDTHPLNSPQHKGDCIYYYAAVNAVLGPVGLYTTTGCHGAGVKPSEYKVSLGSVHSALVNQSICSIAVTVDEPTLRRRSSAPAQRTCNAGLPLDQAVLVVQPNQHTHPLHPPLKHRIVHGPVPVNLFPHTIPAFPLRGGEVLIPHAPEVLWPIYLNGHTLLRDQHIHHPHPHVP